MQRVTGPGVVFLEVDGSCHEHELGAGEKVVCDTGVVAVMDATCEMDIQMIKGAKKMLFGGEGMFDTVVKGPGKVYLQTMTMPKLAELLLPFFPQKK